MGHPAINCLYEALSQQGRLCLIRVCSETQDKVAFSHVATWCEQGYWQVSPWTTHQWIERRRLTRLITLAETFERKRSPAPPLADSMIYEVRKDCQQQLMKAFPDGRRITAESVGLLFSAGSYMPVSSLLRTSLSEFRRYQDAAFRWAERQR